MSISDPLALEKALDRIAALESTVAAQAIAIESKTAADASAIAKQVIDGLSPIVKDAVEAVNTLTVTGSNAINEALNTVRRLDGLTIAVKLGPEPGA
jgi:hypothetical protein